MAFRECTVHSATIRGVEAVPVSVEVSLSSGVPGFAVVGMTDAAIQEARERVRAAVRACGFSMPGDKLVASLAPGSLKKTGSGFDLPIALAVLVASGQVPPAFVEGRLVVGELSLDGEVRPVNGTLAFQECAREQGLDLLCSADARDAVDVDGVQVKAVERLSDARCGRVRDVLPAVLPGRAPCPDFKHVRGHVQAKRALQVAAAGGHGVLMTGPPGSGKSALAACLPSILPPLTAPERVEAARMRSVVGEDASSVLAGVRPFRAPHHTATLAGLVGGGSPVRPGELSLAHLGVLFLDEVAEFRPNVLQGLRTPMEQGEVRIVRAEGSVVMPARFMLVAASNPCPCGHLGDESVPCVCTPAQVHAYQNRIGGPLMDRIDMHVDVWRVPAAQVISERDGVGSAELYEGVEAARAFACERRAFAASRHKGQEGKEEGGISSLLSACDMDAGTKGFFEQMAEACVLSGRGVKKVLGLARTVADMAQEASVGKAHVAEAFSLRVPAGVGMAAPQPRPTVAPARSSARSTRGEVRP